MRARSISLGAGMQHRPSSSGAASFGSDPPNYRLLLENDADIDADVRQCQGSPYLLYRRHTCSRSQAFVRRILKHNDQQCSLFLQQKVKSTTPNRRQDIFKAVAKHVRELGFSKFGAFPPERLVRFDESSWLRSRRTGNFLVSRCLEDGDKLLAQAYEDSLADHFLALSLDPFGCHVLQKLLDCGGAPTKARVIEECVSRCSLPRRWR
jgi:hypothetical protein